MTHLRSSWLGCFTILISLIAMPHIAAADDGGFTSLDFKPVVNMDWKDDKAGDGRGGWTDQGSTNDMRGAMPGHQVFLGIPFDLIDPATNNGKAVLTLKSRHFHPGPASVTVNVGAKAKSIYFLHAAAWCQGKMGDYIVNYDDGTNVDLPINAGDQICDWWTPTNEKSHRAAFRVPNAECDNVGMVIYGWDNPDADKVIKSIEFKSPNSEGILILAATTLSDKPVSLPDPKDIPTPDYLKSDLDVMDMNQWFPVPSDVDKFDPTPIDQAASLDAPTGKHGFLKNVDGRFVFDDNTAAHLVATGEEPKVPADKATADYSARWLAKYGFNMVRFHPLQGDIVVDPAPDSGTLDPAKMDLLDYYIAQLAKNGVYVRFSMLYYRQAKAGDGLDHFDEALAEAKIKDPNATTVNTMGITFFDPKAQEMNMALEKAIMTHRNPYRDNKMYGEDPAIIQIETTNEDGVFFYTIDGIPKVYKKELDAIWGQWLLKKYESREKLAAAWKDDLAEAEDPAKGSVKRLSINGLAKVSDRKRPRASDQLHFYYELNNGYFTKTKQMLRDAGAKQPINGTCWFGIGNGYWAEQYSNVTGMDYVDRHHYWGGGPGGWQILPGLMFDSSCALKAPEQILKLGEERVIDMPYTISEWTNVLPNQSRLEAAPLMTFYGQGLGGWDAPIHFSNDMSGGHGFVTFLKWMWPVNDPSILCQYPTLSTVIRRADVKEAPLAFVRHISEEQVFSAKPLEDAAVKIDISGIYEMSSTEGINAKAMASIYAAAVGKTGIHFSKDAEPDYSVDLNKYIDMKNKEIHSLTNELYWNYGTGYVTANTPRTQAAVGYFAGVPIKLGDCQIDTSNLIASVLVSSLDGNPLSDSKHILITAVGRSRNTDMAYSRLGTRLLTLGKPPVILEGVKGTITLNRAGNVTVNALSPYGYKTMDVQPRVEGGKTLIPISGTNKAAYYEVTFN